MKSGKVRKGRTYRSTVALAPGWVTIVASGSDRCGRLQVELRQGRYLLAAGTGYQGMTLSAQVRRSSAKPRLLVSGGPGCRTTRFTVRLSESARLMTPRVTGTSTKASTAVKSISRGRTAVTTTVKVKAGAITTVSSVSNTCGAVSVRLSQKGRTVAAGLGGNALALVGVVRSGTLRISAWGQSAPRP